jgi:hypothetical protein
VLASDGKKRTRALTSEEIIDGLRAESPLGLKLYLEHLIFERNDTVPQPDVGGLIVENLSSSGVVAFVY